MKTIGVCDSGIGGLLVMFALHQAYPDLNIVFIADQSHVPYGDKSVAELKSYAQDLLNEFKRRKIKDVVIACNTLCANVVSDLKAEYTDLNLIDIIEPTIVQLKNVDIKKVLVMATTKTVEKKAYSSMIHRFFPTLQVEELACPQLVPLIENEGSNEELQKAVNDYLQDKEFDACVLGCTHFPLVKEMIQKSKECLIFDSNQAVIDALNTQVEKGEGKIEIFTTHDANALENKIHSLFHVSVQVEEISLNNEKKDKK